MPCEFALNLSAREGELKQTTNKLHATATAQIAGGFFTQ
jgi:hypothetical protein